MLASRVERIKSLLNGEIPPAVVSLEFDCTYVCPCVNIVIYTAFTSIDREILAFHFAISKNIYSMLPLPSYGAILL
ncbi:hypothetical protein Hrd1104_01595 [Halorhabdus sp. CBA1104]|nr:hypothetical protein Hrd1104_01595 [Halorhabdus sp. CBA1104]